MDLEKICVISEKSIEYGPCLNLMIEANRFDKRQIYCRRYQERDFLRR